MAGYMSYNEGSGEIVHRMYSHPFVVRGIPRFRGYWDRPEDEAETVAAFRTQAEADAFVAKWGAEYCKGKDGYAYLQVENWNK